MISKHFNITVFNWQTPVIKEACCLIELGNVKLPLVIFKMRTDSSEKNKHFFLEESRLVPLFSVLSELSVSELLISHLSVSTFMYCSLFMS